MVTDSTLLTSPRVRDIEENFERYLATLVILVYTAIILNLIVGRILYPNIYIPWQQEVIIGLFIWAAWLSVASVVRKDGHIRFTMFIEKFSNRGVYVVYWIEWLLWFLLAGVILAFAPDWIGQFVDSGSDIIGTSVPKYALFLSVPVGWGLVVLRILQQMVIVTRKYRAGEELATTSEVFSE